AQENGKFSSNTLRGLPITFEPYYRQTDPQIRFVARGKRYELFLTSTGAQLSLLPVRNRRTLTGQITNRNSQVTDQRLATMKMTLWSANRRPEISPLDQLPAKTNYVIGCDPKHWRTNVPNFARVKYQNVYDGIDLVYYGNQQQLEYDFLIAPRANPSVIKLDVRGIDHLQIDGQGDLLMTLGDAQLQQLKPSIYQEIDGVRRVVSGRYILTGKHQIGFELGSYDHHK